MRRFTARFLNDDRGATAIEYTLIAVAAITAMRAVGTGLNNTLNGVVNNLN